MRAPRILSVACGVLKNWVLLLLDHMKKVKNNALVGNTGHFDNEIDLGLGRHESRSFRRSSRLPCSSRGDNVLLRAYKNEVYFDEEVAKLHLLAPRCRDHCPYSGTSSIKRCQGSRPFTEWALRVSSCDVQSSAAVAWLKGPTDETLTFEVDCRRKHAYHCSCCLRQGRNLEFRE